MYTGLYIHNYLFIFLSFFYLLHFSTDKSPKKKSIKTPEKVSINPFHTSKYPNVFKAMLCTVKQNILYIIEN